MTRREDEYRLWMVLSNRTVRRQRGAFLAFMRARREPYRSCLA